jgi:hypothetical protein
MIGEGLNSTTYISSRKRLLAAGAAGLSLLASGCSNSSGNSNKSTCDKFVVYAQNRWDPLGAALRQEPSKTSKQIGGVTGNDKITVDGWLHSGTPIYPNNTAPWNNDVWFRLANHDGFVSFPGVRGTQTTPDPTHGLNHDGGQPAPLTPACEVSYKK